MSDENYQEEEYHETYDYDDAGEGDQWDPTAWQDAEQVEEIKDSLETIFPQLFANYASIIQRDINSGVRPEDAPETPTLTGEQAHVFLGYLGIKDDYVAGIPLDDVYTGEQLLQHVADSGYNIQTEKKMSSVFNSLLTGLESFYAFVDMGLISKEHQKPAETRIVLGEVKGDGETYAKFTLNKYLDQQQQAVFDATPDIFFLLTIDLELTTKDSVAFLQECFDALSKAINFLSSNAVNYTCQFIPVEGSETALRMNMIFNVSTDMTALPINFFLDRVFGFLPEFNCAFKWDSSFTNVIDTPVRDLTNIEFQASLPRIGLAPALIQKFAEVIFGFAGSVVDPEALDNAGFNTLREGNADVTLDLSTTTQNLFDAMGILSDPGNTLRHVIQHFAPVGQDLVSGLTGSTKPTDQLKGVQQIIRLIQIILGRDFVDLHKVSFRLANGYGFTGEYRNFCNIRNLFDFIHAVLDIAIDE